MDNYELNINPTSMCRVCLVESTEMKPIFCIEIVNGGVVPFPQVFESITNIKVKQKDGFPENLCCACKTTIRDSYVLKQKCQQNRELLCSILGIVLEVDEKICIPAAPPKPVMITIETQTENRKKSVASTQTTAHEGVGAHTQTVASRSVGVHTQTAATVLSTIETQTTTPTPQDIEQAHDISIIATASDIQLQSTSEHSLEYNATMKLEATDADSLELLEIEEEDIAYDDEERLEFSTLEEDDQYESEERAEYEGDGVQMNSNADNAYSDADMEDITTTAEYLLDDEELESVEKVFFCTRCDNEYSTQLEFDQHQPLCDMPPPRKRRRAQKPSVSDTPKVIRVKSETQDKKRAKFCSTCNHYLSLGSTSYELHMACHERSMPMLVESVQYYRCGGCLIVFISPEQLETHLNSSEFECGVSAHFRASDSNAQIPKDRDLMDVCQRLYSCTKLNDDLLICDWCSEYTDAKVNGILDHIKETHFEDVNVLDVQSQYFQSLCVPHKCGVCSDSFDTLPETLKHVYLHSTVFQCPYNHCSDSYTKFHLLHQHLERNHMDGSMEYGCRHCAALFTNYGEYRTHLRTQCQERTIPCDICEKKFFSKNTLAIHRKYHFNDKKFSCGYCDKKFTQSGDLKTHQRIHTGSKPYKCTLCDKAFRSSGNRKDHMSVHEEEKRFVCSYCDLQCKSERTLRGHMTLHTNTKKFRCDICQKPFHRAYHLKTHMRVHDQDSYELSLD